MYSDSRNIQNYQFDINHRPKSKPKMKHFVSFLKCSRLRNSNRYMQTLIDEGSIGKYVS